MLMGYQMGFAVANVLDPTSEERVSIIGQFIFIFGILYFLALDGHHMLIRALDQSYVMAPPMGVGLTGGTVTILVRMFTGMFVIGLQIALPIIGTLFLIDVSLGIIAKTVPQMNVFIIGLPLKTLVGLMILTATFGLISFFMRIEVGRLATNLGWLIRSIFVGG
jgi:flagellar biosynthetic protein FliR